MARAAQRFLIVAAAGAAGILAGCGGGSDTSASSPPFAPHATLEVVGGSKRTDKPKFVLRVDARPGDDNIRSATVLLPPVVLVDAEAISGLCGHGELESNHCAKQEPLGSARVVSPAFKGELTGPVYAISGPGRRFGLAYVLSGPIELLLEGEVVTKGRRMQAGVEDVPDTPLRTFELTIAGGEHGYLTLSSDLCAKTQTATATFTGQEGETHEQQVPLEAECP